MKKKLIAVALAVICFLAYYFSRPPAANNKKQRWIPTAQGFVSMQGIVRGLDTSMFKEGDILCLSTDVVGGLEVGSRETCGPHFVGQVLDADSDSGMILLTKPEDGRKDGSSPDEGRKVQKR